MIPVVEVATATPMLGPAPDGETHQAIKAVTLLVGTPGGVLLPTEGVTLAVVVAAEVVTPTMVTTETDETIAVVVAATLMMTTLMMMMVGTTSLHRRRPPLKL